MAVVGRAGSGGRGMVTWGGAVWLAWQVVGGRALAPVPGVVTHLQRTLATAAWWRRKKREEARLGRGLGEAVVGD